MVTNKPGAIIIEGHVQGLSNTRSLGEAGIPVFVVDKTSCIAKYSKFCKKFFICPDFNTNEFAEFLINLSKKENIFGWALIPSNDHAVYTISRYKNELEKYYKVITPGLDIIEQIYDKSRLLDVGIKCGIPVPVTQYFNSPNDKLNEKISFPVITKGRNGLSFYKSLGKKAFLAYNENELRFQLELVQKKYSIAGTFTQELIPFDGTNKTVSFTAFCVDGNIKTYWMGVKLREHPLQFGTATFAKSIFIEECLIQSIPLLKELHYTGVCEIEYLLDPRSKQYKLIEINARTWLWVGLAKASGIDYAKMIYDFVNQQEDQFPQSYKIDQCWINPFSDVAYAFFGIIKGKIRLSNYLKSIINSKKVNALFVKGDCKPGYAYLFNVFSFLNER
jgi:D-aspartate ligase